MTEGNADYEYADFLFGVDKWPAGAPDLEELQQWESEGYCYCSGECECVVEPDGTCPNGHKSWLLVLGLI